MFLDEGVVYDTFIRKESATKNTVTAEFIRKPTDTSELRQSSKPVNAEPFYIAKIVELNEREYQYFSTHLLIDAPFIAGNLDCMGYDERNGARRCLLITTPTGSEALAVDSSGYNYARYTAYIPDKSVLELNDVPVQQFGAYPVKLPNERARGGDR